MTVLAAYNIKGGVGKTAVAVNLAYLAAQSGAATLLCDLDPQGAATYCFRIKPKVRGGAKKLLRGRRSLSRHIRAADYDGLDVLPADFSYRHLDLVIDDSRSSQRLARRLSPLTEQYEYVFLDCAPSISRVSEAVFAAADALVVPTIPTTLSVRTLEQLTRHLRKQEFSVSVLPFFSMVDRRKGLHRRLCAADGWPVPMLETAIPYSSAVEQMSVRREPLPAYAPGQAATRAYERLWEEVARERHVAGASS